VVTVRFALALGLALSLGAMVEACGTNDGAPPGSAGLVISRETGPLVCPRLAPIECAVDVGERLPLVVTGSTIGRDDGYGGASCGLGGDAIEDVAVRWTAGRAGVYHVTTAGSAYDTLLSVRNGSCAGHEIACNDDAEDGTTTSALTLDLAACQTVTLVVDGRTTAIGDFRLAVHGNETVCDDGVDDDGDGATDCADDDCFGRICPGSDAWPMAWADMEFDVVTRINAERAAGATCGATAYPPAPPLEADRPMREAARLHSKDMADQDYFSHDSVDGRMLTDRVAEAGWAGAGPLGENIAAGLSDPATTVAGWMASEGHCTNIMNPAFHVTGVGYATGAGGDRWTQDFGGSH